MLRCRAAASAHDARARVDPALREVGEPLGRAGLGARIALCIEWSAQVRVHAEREAATLQQRQARENQVRQREDLQQNKGD